MTLRNTQATADAILSLTGYWVQFFKAAHILIAIQDKVAKICLHL